MKYQRFTKFLIYQRFAQSGCKDKDLDHLSFLAKTQFLLSVFKTRKQKSSTFFYEIEMILGREIKNRLNLANFPFF